MSLLHSASFWIRPLLAGGSLVCPFLQLEASWSTPVAISSTTSDQPCIAVDKSGNAVLVWQGYDGTNYIINAATQSFSGSWTMPVALSDSGQDAQGPSVGVDRSGNATAVWSRYDGWNSIVQGATLPFNSSWSSPVNISEAGQNADSAKVAVEASGNVNNAVAVWHRYNGSNFIVESSSLTFGGTWSAPACISASGQDALAPVVAIDPNGNAAAVCSRYDGANFASRAAAYMSGQTWGSSFSMSTPGSTTSGQSIEMDALGNSVIAWSYNNGTNNVIQATKLHFGDGFTTVIDISTEGQDCYVPKVEVALGGTAIVVWTGFDGINYVAQAAMMNLLGEWSSPVVLSTDGGDVNNLAVEMDSVGNGVAVWDKSDGTNSIVQAATYSIISGWSDPVDISTAGQHAYLPTVDIDLAGNATAAWLQFNGTTHVVYSSTLLFGS